MAVATTFEKVVPAAPWSGDDGGTWTTPGMGAGGAAWDILTHHEGFALDMAMVLKMPAPADLSDAREGDIHGFIWDVITEAGRIGYTYAKLEPAFAEAARWNEKGEYRSEIAISRAVAAILGMPLVEDPDDAKTGAVSAA